MLNRNFCNQLLLFYTYHSSMKQLQFPQLGISLNEYLHLTRNTKFTRNARERYLNGESNPAHRHTKKSKKQERQMSAESASFHLQNSTFVSPKPHCSIESMRLNSLPKHCVPNYMKTLEIYKDFIEIETTKLVSNRAKNQGWMVECLGNRTKLLMETQKLIGLQQPAYYQMDFQMFCQIFQKEISDITPEQQVGLFNEFKLNEDLYVFWPVGLFQPLNFQGVDEIRQDFQSKKCRDDRVKINFTPKPQVVQTPSENCSEILPVSQVPSMAQLPQDVTLPKIQEEPLENSNIVHPEINEQVLEPIIIPQQEIPQISEGLQQPEVRMIEEQPNVPQPQPIEEPVIQKQQKVEKEEPKESVVFEDILPSSLKMEEQIPKFQTIVNRQPKQDNEGDQVLIWFIGTNIYKFVPVKDLIHVNEIVATQALRIFKETRLNSILEDFSQLISMVNLAIKKYDHCDLKNDEKKYFMHRLIKRKAEAGTDNLHIALRFKQSKQLKQVLILNLRSGRVTWQNPESLVVSYFLPKFTQKQLKTLLVLPLLDPSTRQQFFLSKLLKSFHHIHHQESPFVCNFFQKSHTDVTEFQPRCKTCNYKISSKRQRSIQCYFCHSFYHSDCDEESRFLRFQGEKECWCCSNCVPCEICFLKINKPELVECMTCKNHFHQKCGVNKNTTAKFECQDCLKCDLCLKKLSNYSQECFFQADNIYCQSCMKLLQKGDYCKICKGNQPKTQWIKCDMCTGWIHKLCDETLKNNYKHFTQSSVEYNCPCCRDATNRSFMIDLIKIMIKFDEFGYFNESVSETLIDYKDIIAKPMCFSQMIEQCRAGMYDSNSFELVQRDVDLIISNAMEYNMPKDLCHYSARVLKLMMIQFFNFFKPFFELTPTTLITDKTIPQAILDTEKKLFKYIYEHYLQIILNYGYTKSQVSVKMKPVDPPYPFIFQSRQLLKLFKNSQISISFTKNEPLIDHLFSQPKIFQPCKLPITKPICYYHNQLDIISTCDICLQSFCCVKQCLLHRRCTHCQEMSCRCDSWGCGCPPGIHPKDLEHPNLRDYKNDILTITQMFRYCPRCAIQKIDSWKCKYCSLICTYNFKQCKHCSKHFHKHCAPKEKIVTQLCMQCSEIPANYLRKKEALQYWIKTNLNRMKRVEKLVPTAAIILNSQGINLEPSKIRELLFNNYSSIEEYFEEIECYDANREDIDAIKMMEESLENDVRAIQKGIQKIKTPLTDLEVMTLSQPVFQLTYFVDGMSIPEQGLFGSSDIIESRDINVLWMKVDQCISLYSTYRYFHPEQQQEGDMIVEQPLYQQLPTKLGIFMNLLFQIRQAKTVYLISCLQRLIFDEKRGSFPQQTIIKKSSARKHLAIKSAVKCIILEIYNEMKLYSRVGSTCLINLSKNHIQVYKKWSRKPGLWISLWKEGRTWRLKVNNSVTVINSFKELIEEIRKISGGAQSTIRTIEDLSRFLGFNIYESEEESYTYTSFLQSHPLESADRKTAVLQAYSSLKINKVQRKQLFFMRKKKKQQNYQQPSNKPPSHYFLFQQIQRQLQDQPFIQKHQLKRTDPSKQIFIAPSTIHKLGLFSTKFQKKNTVLIEYMGEILSEPMSDLRESLYHLGCYMFAIPKKLDENPKLNQDATYDSSTPHINNSKRDVIDATYRGNQARYLNHSCDPNCASMIDERDGTPRILIYAIKDIQQFQELTYDYQFKVTAGEKIICTCKAKNCQGRLN